MKLLLYRSKNDPDQSITVGQRDDNLKLCLPGASGSLSDEENQFDSIEQIETLLNDQLELIVTAH